MVVSIGDNDTGAVTDLFLCFGVEKSVPAGDILNLLTFQGDIENEKK